MRRPGGLTRTPIDQPCLSLDLSTARERLAVRLCLAMLVTREGPTFMVS